MDSSGGRVVAGSNPVTPTGKEELSLSLNSFFYVLPARTYGSVREPAQCMVSQSSIIS